MVTASMARLEGRQFGPGATSLTKQNSSRIQTQIQLDPLQVTKSHNIEYEHDERVQNYDVHRLIEDGFNPCPRGERTRTDVNSCYLQIPFAICILPLNIRFDVRLQGSFVRQSFCCPLYCPGTGCET